ncbi:MAG: calcium/sodium antiporter [Eubacteriales bacterium]|nr:calcium/sodium antiporter [bacterium]MDY2791606.1 calcium/sodium antiporter [Eubacteriales bacterium]
MQSLAVIILLFVLGLVLIIKGGDWFVDAAGWIAEVSGIPRFIVGATIVSVATTLPELFVSSIAASKGQAEMAIGNAIGSVTANTALIMALSMVFLPVTLKRKDYLFKSVLLMGTVALLWALCGDGTLPVARGVIMFVVFALFIWENVKAAKKEDANEPEEKPEKPTRQTVLKNIVLFVLGAAGIVIGSDLLVDNGTLLAQRLGVPENVVALTAVAIGTSLPELVTAITSIVKKEASLSVGNVIGANIIDTALILPVCSVISGGTLQVAASTVRVDMPVCLAVTMIALIPALISQRFRRWQGILLIGIYIAYLAVVCL